MKTNLNSLRGLHKSCKLLFTSSTHNLYTRVPADPYQFCNQTPPAPCTELVGVSTPDYERIRKLSRENLEAEEDLLLQELEAV